MNRIVVKSCNRGSFTLEAALVISTVLMLLFLLVFLFLVMYQKALLQKTAVYVAQQGAEIWVDSRKTIENGAFDNAKDDDGLYYRAFGDFLFSGRTHTEEISLSSNLNELLKQAKRDNLGNAYEKKLCELRRGVYAELGRGLLKPGKTRLEIKYRNILVQRQLEVAITQEVKLPMGHLVGLFSSKSTLTLEGRGTAVVAEPAEYIRNIDLGLEYANRFGNAISFDGLLDKIKGSAADGR